MNSHNDDEMTPVERVEALFDELVLHYEHGDKREERAAAKLLLVALDQFQRHGGRHWFSTVEEYFQLAKNDPQRFQRILQGDRFSGSSLSEDSLH